VQSRALFRCLALALILAISNVQLATNAEAKSKSAGMAFVLSLACTLIPIAVTAGLWATGDGVDEDVRLGLGMAFLGLGTIVGPSAGAFYTEDTGEAFLTMGIRAVTGSIMLSGVGLYTRGGDDRETLGTALTIVGAVPTGLVLIYDLWTAPKKARASDRAARTVAQMEEAPRLNLGAFTFTRAAGSTAATTAAIEPTLSIIPSLRLQTFR